MPGDQPSQASSSRGIHVGDVGGNVSFMALGDIVGGDKIVNISTTTQISVEAVTQYPLVTASPYRGLDRFEDRDRDLFFGRDQLIKSLLAQLSNTNVLLVLGASGSGKSSVVRAGLLPALSRLLGARFRYFTLVPDANPFESLRSNLHSAGFSQSQTRDLVDAQPAAPSRLIHALQREDDQWLVFVDQFEEIFTLSEERLRKSFIAALLEIARDTAASTKLVLAMRADFLDRFSAFPQFAKLIEKNINLVADMHSDELRLAIEQPAARHGIVFEQGLVEEIIKDVQGQAGSLPLLQYTLDLLWEEERRSGGLDDRHLNTRTYRELGGVRGALQKRADEIYASFGDHADPKRASAKQEIARQIFLRLVDIAGEGSDDAVWRPVRRRAAMSLFSAPQEAELLQELINQKLLVSNRKGTEATVEVAHEALFTSWERLKKWIEGGKQVLFVKNRLADDARRWHRRQQEDSVGAEEELLSGSRLGQALEMRDSGEFVTIFGSLPEMEAQFLDASAALRDRRRQEAEQLVREREESRRQLERQLAEASWLVAQGVRGSSYASREESPIKAAHYLLRASSAAAAAGDVLARRDASLAAQITGSSALHTLLHDGAVFGAITSPDGQRVLTLSLDGTARLWQALDGTPVGQPMKHEDCDEARFSADGRRILTWSRHGAMRLWDAADGTPVGQPMKHEDYLNGVEFTPDGQRILAWNISRSTSPPTECQAQLWQATDGAPVGQPMKHENWVEGARFSADGRRILTWSRDGTARLWQATDGAPVGQPMQHEGGVEGAQFSADGQLILTWGNDDTARLWQATDGSPVGQPMQHEGWISVVQFSADGQRILTRGADDTARLWQTTDGTPVGRPMHHEELAGTLFSADGEWVLTWNQDGTARLWQAADGTPVGEPMQHEGGIEGAQFSADGRMILTWSRDGTARLWQATDGAPVGEPMRRGRPHTEAEFSPDGQRILTWSDFRTVQLWQASNGMPVGPPMTHEGWISGAQFSADGQRILTWSRDGTARLWKVTDGTPVGQPKQLEEPTLKVQSSVTAQFSIAGQRILTWIDDRTVRLWEETDGTPVGQPMQHETPIVGARFSTDGRRMVTWSEGGTARLWETADGMPVGQPIQHKNYAEPQFSGDGQRILTWIDGDAVRLWQAINGTPVGQPMRHEDSINGAQFSADGQRILTWSRHGTVRFWLTSDGTPVGQPFRHAAPGDRDWEIRGVQWSADGRRVLTLSNASSARLWQAADGTPVGQPMEGEVSVDGAQFSADGQQFLTWSLVKLTVQLWQASDGTPVGQPMKHEGPVFWGQLSADGRRILTGTGDGTVRLWHAADRTLVGQLIQNRPSIIGEFSADGERILTWGGDGTVRLWSVGNTQCIAAFKHEGLVESACFNRDETRILTAIEDGTARLWDISVDERIPADERVLEFEVRSATTLGSDGQVRVLRVAEWEQKKAKLLEAEIRSEKAIVPRGDAPPLTTNELSARQRQLAALRQRLSK